MLQLGLLALCAKGRRGQGVDAAALQATEHFVAPVHGDEGLGRCHLRAGHRRQHQAAAARLHLHQVALLQLQTDQVAGVQFDAGLAGMAVQPAQRAGARQPVPMVAQAAGVQAERIVRVARFRQRLHRHRGKGRAAVGRGEASVGVKALRTRGLAFAQRPLLRALRVEHGVAQAGDVEVAAARALAVLIPQVFGRVEGEQCAPIDPPHRQQRFHAPGHVDGDAPVVPCLPRRRHGWAYAADAALAVGDGAVFLAPAGGRQQQVGVGRGGGGGKGILHDDELATLQRAAHAGLVGEALRGIGADDPQRRDLAVGRGLEHLQRALAGLGRHIAQAPQRGDFGAVPGIRQFAMCRQLIGQSADLAPAHRVRLPGQRERPGPWLADLPGGQVQVDQRGVLVGAADALVQALAVQGQRRRRLSEPACRLHQVGFRDAAQPRRVGGRVVAHPVAQGVEAGGVRVDEGAVHQALPQQQVQQAIEQRHIGAGLDLQVQVGGRRGFGAARVDHDPLLLGLGTPRVFEATEQHRVGPGHVAADDEHRARMVQVFVAARRRVGAERAFVAGHCTAHAKARIGVDIVGAEQPLAQLVEGVIVLGEQLPAEVQADGIGPARACDIGQARGGLVQRRVPAHRLGTRAPPGAAQRLQQPRLPGDFDARRQVQGAALGAQAAEVGGVLGVAAHAGDLRRLAFDDDAAAHAAIGAGGADFAARHGADFRPCLGHTCASAASIVAGVSRMSPPAASITQPVPRGCGACRGNR